MELSRRLAVAAQALTGLLGLHLSYFPLGGSLCLCGSSQSSPAEKIGEHLYRLGSVTVDTARKRVRVPCRVNMSRGMIEYLAVAAEGKRHESVLLVEAEPLHV